MPIDDRLFRTASAMILLSFQAHHKTDVLGQVTYVGPPDCGFQNHIRPKSFVLPGSAGIPQNGVPLALMATNAGPLPPAPTGDSSPVEPGHNAHSFSWCPKGPAKARSWRRQHCRT